MGEGLWKRRELEDMMELGGLQVGLKSGMDEWQCRGVGVGGGGVVGSGGSGGSGRRCLGVSLQALSDTSRGSRANRGHGQ